MARLPDETSLGPLPRPQSGRPIATGDLSGYARGAAARAEGIKDLGRGIERFGNAMQAASDREQAAQDELDLARARSQWNIAALESSSGIPNTDAGGDPYDGDEDADLERFGIPRTVAAPPQQAATPVDPNAGPASVIAGEGEATTDVPSASGGPSVGVGTSGPGGGYTKSYTGPVPATTGNPDIDKQVDALRTKGEEIAAGIRDPKRRELFKIGLEDDIYRKRVMATRKAHGVWREQQLLELQEKEKQLTGGLLNERDPGTRAEALAAHMGLVDAYAKGGLISASQAYKWKQNFKNNYGVAWAESEAGKGRTGQVISDIEQSRMNQSLQPPPPGPQSSLTPQQMAAVRGSANNARPSPEWGNPGTPGFEENHLSTIKLQSGKTVTVNRYAAQAFTGFLNELEASGYPINDIGGYNYRNKRGGNTLSQHAFGNAIDINPDKNPFQRGLKTDLPPNISEIAAKYGISWGGDWNGKKDAMHFEYTGIQPSGNGRVQVASADPSFTPGGPATAAPQAAVAQPGAAPAPAPVDGQQVAQVRPTIYDAMDPITREKLYKKMLAVKEQQDRAVAIERNKVSAANAEKLERKLIDANAGRAPLIDREEIENAPLEDNHKNALLVRHGALEPEIRSFQGAMERFNAKQPFSHYIPEDKKNVDRLFQHFGGTDAAMTKVVDTTGVLPASAAVKMRGDIISGDPERVIAGATRAANLQAHPQHGANIFAGIDGGEELEKNAIKFRYLVDTRGMTAQEAAIKMIEHQQPEYKAKVAARIKTEDVDDIVKKKVKLNDLENVFDPGDPILGIFSNDPKIQNNVDSRAKMFNTFTEIVKEKYLDSDSGDIGEAIKQAGEELKKTHGISTITGKNVVMPWAPERAPHYANIPNVKQEDVADAIAQRATESIKEATGTDVKRENLRIEPVLTTAQEYKSGKPPTYRLSWKDQRGLWQTQPIGTGFRVDRDTLSKAATAIRDTKSAAAAAQAEADQTRSENAPVRQIGKAIGDVVKGVGERLGDPTINLPNPGDRPITRLPTGDTLGTIRQRKLDSEAGIP
jgi:hypothetical protein